MIDNDLFQNILVKNLHDKKRRILVNRFSDLNTLDTKSYLFLDKYHSNIPEKFYNEHLFTNFLDTLNNFALKNDDYIEMLNNFEKEINISFSTIEDINALDFHNKVIQNDKAHMQLLCSQFYNPSYLQLVESVYSPLIKILAYISRMNRSASIEGLDIFNCSEELKGTNLDIFLKDYRHIVRNGIAHGYIEYNFREVIYTDKRHKSESLTYDELVELYNDLLDCCNACILALKLFYLKYINKVNVPDSMIFEILKSEVCNPWWDVSKFLVSAREDNKSQLNIFIEVNAIEYLKVYYSSFQTAILAEQLFPNYDYYFLSFQSNIAYSGYAMFNGKKLKKVKDKNPTNMDDYINILQDNMVFYSTKIQYPKFINKLETYWYSGKIHFPMSLHNFHQQIGYLDFEIKNIKIFRRSFFLIITGDVVFYNVDTLIHKEIQKKNKRTD